MCCQFQIVFFQVDCQYISTAYHTSISYVFLCELWLVTESQRNVVEYKIVRYLALKLSGTAVSEQKKVVSEEEG